MVPAERTRTFPPFIGQVGGLICRKLAAVRNGGPHAAVHQTIEESHARLGQGMQGHEPGVAVSPAELQQAVDHGEEPRGHEGHQVAQEAAAHAQAQLRGGMEERRLL